MRKLLKALVSLAFTALSATVAGACYEHGRKIGKEEKVFSPDSVAEAANGIVTQLVLRFVEHRAKLVEKNAARKNPAAAAADRMHARADARPF